MSVKYKLYQNKREGSSTKGKWYARAAADGLVTTDQLAETMQRNCTLKRSDIIAVISELVETMQTALQNGQRGKLDKFGSFKIGITSAPADTAKDFNVGKHVKGLHVLFQPEVKISADKKRTRSFLTGCKVEEYADYRVDKKKDKAGKKADPSAPAGTSEEHHA